MERDELIIWVYLWVCEKLENIKAKCPKGQLRRTGFAPALSDEEALTIELCGEMFRLHHDKAIFGHFKTYYQSWLPELVSRSQRADELCALMRQSVASQAAVTGEIDFGTFD